MTNLWLAEREDEPMESVATVEPLADLSAGAEELSAAIHERADGE